MSLPGAAAAAPGHPNRLTLAATPDPITAGQGVLIYGQLTGPNNANQRIWLFHRINPAAQFTPIGSRVTNGQGYFEFIRADGVVTSNRNWYVVGPDRTRSHVVHELVAAVVSLNAGSTTTTTTQPVQFSGTVFPKHVHQRVVLQEQDASSGNGWHTIAVGVTDGSSNFSISHRFRSAGNYTLRAYLLNDPRNTPGASPQVTLTVQQEQNPQFTINGSAPVITNGQTETISGTLYSDSSATSGQPNVNVTLYGRQGRGTLRALESTSTDSSGNYTFTQMPLHNSVYVVRVTSGPRTQTARLFVGVQDVVTATVSASTVAVGDAVKVTGSVTPDHSGHVVYLQVQGPAGHWADVETGSLTPGSTFAFSYTPGQTGAVNLRVQITGGPWNIGALSSVLPVTVSGAAPVNTLPPAS